MLQKNYIQAFIWKPYSRERGLDIVFGGKRISIKSGQETKDRFKFSSFRTTSLPTMKEKVEMMKLVEENIDGYLYIARREIRQQNQLSCTAFFIESGFVDYNNFDFTESDKSWKSNKVDGVQLTISKSASEQLSCFIDREKMSKVSKMLFNKCYSKDSFL